MVRKLSTQKAGQKLTTQNIWLDIIYPEELVGGEIESRHALFLCFWKALIRLENSLSCRYYHMIIHHFLIMIHI